VTFLTFDVNRVSLSRTVIHPMCTVYIFMIPLLYSIASIGLSGLKVQASYTPGQIQGANSTLQIYFGFNITMRQPLIIYVPPVPRVIAATSYKYVPNNFVPSMKFERSSFSFVELVHHQFYLNMNRNTTTH
jgi:hypothetical protein